MAHTVKLAVADDFYCDGSCYSVNCATVMMLKNGPAPRLMLSAAAKTVLGSSTSLTLTCGIAIAFALVPCASSGTQHSPGAK